MFSFRKQQQQQNHRKNNNNNNNLILEKQDPSSSSVISFGKSELSEKLSSEPSIKSENPLVVVSRGK